MPISKNARFIGPDKPGAEHYPLGNGLLKAIQSHVKSHGYAVKPVENWRDTGWEFFCSLQEEDFQVVLCSATENEWFMQIAPEFVPGLIARLLGKRASAESKGTFQLAKTIHMWLTRDGAYSNFRWAWDGPPKNRDLSEPTAHILD